MNEYALVVLNGRTISGIIRDRAYVSERTKQSIIEAVHPTT